MSVENVFEPDVLIIGGGIAGCFAAIAAKQHGLDVTIVDKGYAGKSGASISASASTMVFNPEWGHDFDACMNAFITVCEYVSNRDWCSIILQDSLEIFHDRISWGVEFADIECAKSSTPVWPHMPPFGTVGLRFRKQSPVLREHAEKVGVRIMDRIMVTDLLKQDGEVVGAIGFPMESYDVHIFKARATILCGGGNSFKGPGFPIWMLTGDAEAMAYRAGAEITGKEFPSPHPTRPINSASAGFNYRLGGGLPALPFFTDAEGNRYPTFLIGGETGTRGEPDLSPDFVAHAGKGPLVCDFDMITPEMAGRIRSIHQQMFGSEEPMHLPSGKLQLAGGGAAGYSSVGSAGVWVVDTKCATSVPGLYVAGDCAGTRHNGAFNCNTGMGTTPAAVTGRRAGIGAAQYALQRKKPIIDDENLSRSRKTVIAPAELKGGFSTKWVTQLLQSMMIPYYISHIKHEKRLKAALTIIEFIRDHLVPRLPAKDSHELRLSHETKNMVLNAEMILNASLFRTESRGLHYREDYPRRDDPAWLAWTRIKEHEGKMKVFKEPIPTEWWPDLSKPYRERYPMRYPGEAME